MRVQPAHRDPRPLDEPRQCLVGQVDHLADPHGLHAINRLAQAHMGTDVGDRQLRHRQHHREVLGAAQTRDELGMAHEVRLRHPRRLLVHRQRDDARYLACQRVACRTVDVGQRRRTCLRIQHSRRNPLRVHQPLIADVQRAFHRLLRPIDRENRHVQAKNHGRTHQYRRIAIHHDIAAQQSLGKPAHDNLRPDARSISHCHRHRPPTHDCNLLCPSSATTASLVRSGGGGPSELGVSDGHRPVISRCGPERTERSEPDPPLHSEKASVRWDPLPRTAPGGCCGTVG